MNETVIQKPMRAVALFAIATALAALSGFSPSRAFADDTPQVTVQVNATSKSGQPLTAEEAQLIAEAAQANPGPNSTAPCGTATTNVDASGNAWVSGNSTRVQHYLSSIVISDNAGNSITFKGKTQSLGADFTPQKSISGHHALGSADIYVSNYAREGNSRVELTFGKLTTSITVTYNYVVTDPYTVSFVADETSVAAYNRWRGDEFGEAPAAPEKAGYLFTGWQDATGTPYNPEASVSRSVEYTAKYAPEYTVSWNLDGGTLDGQSSLAESSGLAEDTVPLPANDPERTGYTFKGWAIEGSQGTLDLATTYTFSELTGDASTSVTIVASGRRIPTRKSPRAPRTPAPPTTPQIPKSRRDPTGPIRRSPPLTSPAKRPRHLRTAQRMPCPRRATRRLLLPRSPCLRSAAARPLPQAYAWEKRIARNQTGTSSFPLLKDGLEALP